jgi:hypothetical protein
MAGGLKDIIPYKYNQKEGERQLTSPTIQECPLLLHTCTPEVLGFALLKICFNRECNKNKHCF